VSSRSPTCSADVPQQGSSVPGRPDAAGAGRLGRSGRRPDESERRRRRPRAASIHLRQGVPGGPRPRRGRKRVLLPCPRARCSNASHAHRQEEYASRTMRRAVAVMLEPPSRARLSSSVYACSARPAAGSPYLDTCPAAAFRNKPRACRDAAAGWIEARWGTCTWSRRPPLLTHATVIRTAVAAPDPSRPQNVTAD
jgi:hypothetical protein